MRLFSNVPVALASMSLSACISFTGPTERVLLSSEQLSQGTSDNTTAVETVGDGALTVTGNSLYLGRASAGNSLTKAFTLVNLNASSVTVGSAVVGSPFSVTGSCLNGSIAPGGTCQMMATFSPTGLGSVSATALVTYGNSKSVEVELSGVGVPQLGLDDDFAQGGKLVLTGDTAGNDGSGLCHEFSAVAVTDEDEILAAGSGDGGLCVTKLLPDGTPDTSFGTNGIAFFAYPGNYSSYARAVAIDGQGRIYLGGNLLSLTTYTYYLGNS